LTARGRECAPDGNKFAEEGKSIAELRWERGRTTLKREACIEEGLKCPGRGRGKVSVIFD